MLQVITPKRGTDGYGSGEFGAARGNGRNHNGVDYACYPGSQILSPVRGRVTKLGYPYGDDLAFRYVEISDYNLLRHRLFYVDPGVEVGELIEVDQIIGTAQHIAGRYNKKPDNPMTGHVHYEIMDEADNYLDPEELR